MDFFRDEKKIDKEMYDCIAKTVDELRQLTVREMNREVYGNQYVSGGHPEHENGNYDVVQKNGSMGALTKAVQAMSHATEILARNSYGLMRKNTNPTGKNGR